MNGISEETKKAAEAVAETLAKLGLKAEAADASVGGAAMKIRFDAPKQAVSALKKSAALDGRLGGAGGVRVYTDAEGYLCVEAPREPSMREKVTADETILFGNGRWEEGLSFAVGKGIGGEYACCDLTQIRHLLVGGADGSGKSVFLHTMIYSFLTKYSPDDVRLILCDPKGSEYKLYAGLPHLLTGEIVTDAGEAVRALQWALLETERRYRLFEEKCKAGEGVRNIGEYNASRREGEAKLPFIVIVADEYAPFIRERKKETEEKIQRLAQKARAAGVHLVFSTQETAANVCTGVIKANFPARAVFRVCLEQDSLIALDYRDAEKLLGSGDMIFRSRAGYPGERMQAAYVPYETLCETVGKIGQRYRAQFDAEAAAYIAARR